MRPAEKTFYAALGDRVRIARKATGRSQSWVAELVGVPRTSLILMERGEQPISAYTLARMAAVLETPVDTLLRGTESPGTGPGAAPLPGMPADAPPAVREFVSSVREAAVTQIRRK